VLRVLKQARVLIIFYIVRVIVGLHHSHQSSFVYMIYGQFIFFSRYLRPLDSFFFFFSHRKHEHAWAGYYWFNFRHLTGCLFNIITHGIHSPTAQPLYQQKSIDFTLLSFMSDSSVRLHFKQPQFHCILFVSKWSSSHTSL